MDLKLTRKPYQIALLFTHKNGAFGPISVTQRSCGGAEVEKGSPHIGKVSVHSLGLCEHVCALYLIAFPVDMENNPLKCRYSLI